MVKSDYSCGRYLRQASYSQYQACHNIDKGLILCFLMYTIQPSQKFDLLIPM